MLKVEVLVYNAIWNAVDSKLGLIVVAAEGASRCILLPNIRRFFLLLILLGSSGLLRLNRLPLDDRFSDDAGTLGLLSHPYIKVVNYAMRCELFLSCVRIGLLLEHVDAEGRILRVLAFLGDHRSANGRLRLVMSIALRAHWQVRINLEIQTTDLSCFLVSLACLGDAYGDV